MDIETLRIISIAGVWGISAVCCFNKMITPMGRYVSIYAAIITSGAVWLW